MNTIDNRGLNCPEPLIRTKKAIEESGSIISIVDNEIALENILRFSKNNNLQAEWDKKGADYYITIFGNTKTGDSKTLSDIPECQLTTGKLTYLITSDEFGRGSSELGQLLMKNLIYTLTKTEKTPNYIIFLNSGVKICVEGSKSLDDLTTLKDNGTSILVCGTCLDYYNLKDKLATGQVSNMYDIADILSISNVNTL